MQLISQVQAPFTSLSGIVPQYYSMIASAERIIEIENLSASKSLNDKDINTEKVYSKMQEIRFDNVSFGYGRDSVIENADFTIKKNDFTVISGISGIGKSTLLKLMLGIMKPQSGRIYAVCGGKENTLSKEP